jgi:hypothetical protein
MGNDKSYDKLVGCYRWYVIQTMTTNGKYDDLIIIQWKHLQTSIDHRQDGSLVPHRGLPTDEEAQPTMLVAKQ